MTGRRDRAREAVDALVALIASSLPPSLPLSEAPHRPASDPQPADALLGLLRPLHSWFRLEVSGFDRIPATGPALVVANHGGAVPLDALMAQACVRETTGRRLRILAGSLVFRAPVVADLARALGHVPASREEADRLLAAGELVGVWPEGYAGLGKPVRERYQLQRLGRGGFAAAALRAGAPIVPMAIVGAEEAYPVLGNLASVATTLGLPYVPVTATFPWLGPLGLVPLPSRWRISVGEPIEASGDPDDPAVVLALADRVRDLLRAELDLAVAARGPAFGQAFG